MRPPSVKGELLEPVVEELCAQVEEGPLTRERLEVALEPADIALLDEKIRPTRWYPMAAYGRMLELLAESSGRGRSEELLERGARAARALAAEAGGVSFDTLREELGEEPDVTAAWVSGSVLRHAARQQSCGRWTWVAGPRGSGTYEIELTEAAAVPDCMRILTEVVLRRLHAAIGPPQRRVSSERTAPDRIVFRVGA